jgi:hypothetical protein
LVLYIASDQILLLRIPAPVNEGVINAKTICVSYVPFVFS